MKSIWDFFRTYFRHNPSIWDKTRFGTEKGPRALTRALCE